MGSRYCRTLAFVLALGVAGCGGEAADEADRDLSLAPAESLATLDDVAQEEAPAAQPQTPVAQSPQPRPQPRQEPPPPPREEPPAPRPAPTPLRLPSGTVMTLVASDTLKLNDDILGRMVTATIPVPVYDSQGRVVIPADAVFMGSFSKVQATDSTGASTDVMVLTFDRVGFGGGEYAIDARTDNVSTRTAKGGVSGGDVAKVGAGAVVGAIAGRIIGGNKTGTAVGAIVGTAAGVGIAVATKGEDVIMDSGAPIQITLTGSFTRQP